MWLLLLLAAGLAILIGGAEFLVRGAISLAKHFKISDLAIGLTVVAFGTSTPELAVNLFASAEGNSDIVFGNIVGSNICNILLILGICGCITPLVVQKATTWREIPMAVLACLAFTVMMFDGALSGDAPAGISRLDGLILLVGFGGFLLYVARMMKRDRTLGEQGSGPVHGVAVSVLLMLVGFAGLAFGGRLAVTQAIGIAEMLGVEERIIALTIVALGTSLPELATSAVAAWRANADIAIGNVVGSNLFNLLLVFGASTLVRPLPYSEAYDADLAVMAGSAILLFVFMFTGKVHKLDRWEAMLFLAMYIGYTTLLMIV